MMSANTLERMASAAAYRYAEYVGSPAYWRDKRRERHQMREACLLCKESDLKDFREQVVTALLFMEESPLPSEHLGDALHHLRQHIGFVQCDYADLRKAGMSTWKARRYGLAIEVAEALVEAINL